MLMDVYSVGINVGDRALCMKDYVWIVYLPSCKQLNYKLPVVQNNNNS
jgi:hypothetical protein